MDLSLLISLQQADSAFPSGSFAFSQGLEASSTIADQIGTFDFEAFVEVQLFHRWMTADRVALVRSYRLKNDLGRLTALDREIEASILVDALRAGSRRNGVALLVAHERLGSQAASLYRTKIRNHEALGHLPLVQGLLWSSIGMSESMAVEVSAYQCAASLSTAGIRLGIVPALEAQKTLTRLLKKVASAPLYKVEDDQPLSAFTPLSEIAIMLHRCADQRLFSN
jgi:urease accessory protein